MFKNIVILILCFVLIGCSTDSSDKTISSQPDNTPVLTEAEQGAFDTLLQTEQFAGTRVGFGGTISHQAVAFQILLNTEYAADLFTALQEDAFLAGQLYGLCGLYLTDKEHFDEVITDYQNSPEKVHTFFGCILGDTPLTDLIPAIVNGSWPEAFKNCYE